MSSFHNKKHKVKKMKYPGNFPLVPDDQDIIGKSNEKSGYVKTDQFYYFNKNNIQYRVIGCVNETVFELILDFIEEIKLPIDNITDNL